jgi:HlyD family secretion protein
MENNHRKKGQIVNKRKHFIYFFLGFLAITSLMGCHDQKVISLPGQLEGSYTYISTGYSGILRSLFVTKGSTVQAGQRLFILDLQPEQDQSKVIEQRIIEAKAQKEKFLADYKLRKKLLDRKRCRCRESDSAKDEFDTALANSESADASLKASAANVAALEAELKKAKWMTQQKIVSATASGLVFDIYYHPGELVPNGRAVVSLLDPLAIKIIFYCPEPLLSRIKLNQWIQAFCDNCQDPIKGKITFISPQAEYTPPIIYSNEERQKLVYRVEAQPLLKDMLLKLHSGQPVTVKFERQQG